MWQFLKLLFVNFSFSITPFSYPPLYHENVWVCLCKEGKSRWSKRRNLACWIYIEESNSKHVGWPNLYHSNLSAVKLHTWACCTVISTNISVLLYLSFISLLALKRGPTLSKYQSGKDDLCTLGCPKIQSFCKLAALHFPVEIPQKYPEKISYWTFYPLPCDYFFVLKNCMKCMENSCKIKFLQFNFNSSVLQTLINTRKIAFGILVMILPHQLHHSTSLFWGLNMVQNRQNQGKTATLRHKLSCKSSISWANLYFELLISSNRPILQKSSFEGIGDNQNQDKLSFLQFQ